MADILRLVPENLRSLGFAGIGAAYAPIGIPFVHDIRILFLQNLTDALLLFSYDGINDHIALPRNGFHLLDVETNRDNVFGVSIDNGTSLYVKQLDVPSSGSVYLTTYYAEAQ